MFSMENRDLEETKHCYHFAIPQSYEPYAQFLKFKSLKQNTGLVGYDPNLTTR
jgi:hypothetical protein